MIKQTLSVLFVTAAISGCSTTVENPADYVTYRHEPLVKQVKDGMTKEQVLTLGGPPSSEVNNTVTPGTCNNYVLNVEGKEQPYYVSFDSNGLVNSKGFMTCKEHQVNKKNL